MTLYSPDEMKDIVGDCVLHGICSTLEENDIEFVLCSPDGKEVAVSDNPLDCMNHSTMSIDVGGEVWGVLRYSLDTDLDFVEGVVLMAQAVLSKAWGV